MYVLTLYHLFSSYRFSCPARSCLTESARLLTEDLENPFPQCTHIPYTGAGIPNLPADIPPALELLRNPDPSSFLFPYFYFCTSQFFYSYFFLLLLRVILPSGLSSQALVRRSLYFYFRVWTRGLIIISDLQITCHKIEPWDYFKL